MRSRVRFHSPVAARWDGTEIPRGVFGREVRARVATLTNEIPTFISTVRSRVVSKVSVAPECGPDVGSGAVGDAGSDPRSGAPKRLVELRDEEQRVRTGRVAEMTRGDRTGDLVVADDRGCAPRRYPAALSATFSRTPADVAGREGEPGDDRCGW